MDLLNLLILFLGMVTPVSILSLIIDLLIAGLLFGAIVLKLPILIKNQNKFILIVLTLMVVGYGLIHLIEGEAVRNRFTVEPMPPYNSDMITYVKVVYLMKNGQNYYESLAEASLGQYGRKDQTEIWGWKQPIIFYLWKVFPGGGNSIIYLGLIVFSTNLIAIYFIGKKFLSPVKALLCSYMVWPYFRYPLIEQTIAQVEWWALSAFIVGLALLIYNKRWLAGILFAFCLSIRELFAIPVLFVIMADLVRRDFKQTVKLILPTLLLLVPFYLFVHLQSVSRYQDIQALINNSSRKDVSSGWIYIRPTLAYNSWSYGAVQFRPFLILLIFNSFVLLIKVYRDKNYLDAILLASFLPFFLISFKIGTIDLWHDYWGIYYVPLMLLATPIALNYLSLFKTKR